MFCERDKQWKGRGSDERQFVLLDQAGGYIALRDVPKAPNGLGVAIACERVAMRRGVGLDLREVGEHDGADHVGGDLINAYDFFLDCSLCAFRLNL